MTVIYTGGRVRGRGRTVVEFATVSGDRCGPLPHHVKHSPDGFEWGYGGSGPSELARCLLIDALGVDAWCEPCEGDGRFKLEGRIYAPTGEVVAEERTREDAEATLRSWRADGFPFEGASVQGVHPDDANMRTCQACGGDSTSPLVSRYYHAFKDAFVATWGERWQITDDEIRRWLHSQGAPIEEVQSC